MTLRACPEILPGLFFVAKLPCRTRHELRILARFLQNISVKKRQTMREPNIMLIFADA